jgi:hypothetical protein
MSDPQTGEQQSPPSQHAYERLMEKCKTLEDKLDGKDLEIAELNLALKKVTPFKDAKALSEGDTAELKLAREAYKTFSYTLETERFVIEVMVEPMSKTVDVLRYRMK